MAARAWTRASAGTGREARWAAAGLALKHGDRERAQQAIGDDPQWGAALLRGLIETAAPASQSDPAAALRH